MVTTGMARSQALRIRQSNARVVFVPSGKARAHTRLRRPFPKKPVHTKVLRVRPRRVRIDAYGRFI